MSNSTNGASTKSVYSMSISETVVFIILYSCMDILGIVGNTLVIFVLCAARKRKNEVGEIVSSFFVGSLCWIDLLACLLFMPVDIVLYSMTGSFVTTYNKYFFYRIIHRIRNSSIMLEGGILVLIAYERFRIIYQFHKPRLSKKLCAILLAIPSVITISIEVTQFIVIYTVTTETRRKHIRTYFLIIYYFILFPIAIAAMCAFYIAVGYKIYKTMYRPVSEKIVRSHEFPPECSSRPRDLVAKNVESEPKKSLTEVDSHSLSTPDQYRSVSTMRTDVLNDPEDNIGGINDSNLNTPSQKCATHSCDHIREVSARQRTNGARALRSLITITVVFLVSELFPISCEYGWWPFSEVVSNLFYIQNVINPVIFYFLDTRFRRSFFKLVRPRRTRRRVIFP